MLFLTPEFSLFLDQRTLNQEISAIETRSGALLQAGAEGGVIRANDCDRTVLDASDNSVFDPDKTVLDPPRLDFGGGAP